MKCKKIFSLAAAALVAFTLTSCEALLSSLFGVSIEDRINRFEATLNTPDRTDILDHIHPDMKNRNQLNDPEVLSGSPLDYFNHDFEIGEPEIDADDVATCSFLNGSGATGVIEFAMALDGYDYKILRLTLTLDNVAPEDAFLEFKQLLEKAAEN